jgi:hypothetical protein
MIRNSRRPATRSRKWISLSGTLITSTPPDLGSTSEDQRSVQLPGSHTSEGINLGARADLGGGPARCPWLARQAPRSCPTGGRRHDGRPETGVRVEGVDARNLPGAALGHDDDGEIPAKGEAVGARPRGCRRGQDRGAPPATGPPPSPPGRLRPHRAHARRRVLVGIHQRGDHGLKRGQGVDGPRAARLRPRTAVELLPPSSPLHAAMEVAPARRATRALLCPTSSSQSGPNPEGTS